MKVEQAKRIASKAIEQLSEALERGHSETLRHYLEAMAMFHRYSLHNLMLIVSQRPDATRVAGFHTWKQLGRNVKKGAKGIMILAPVLFRKSKEEVTSEEDQSKAAVGFRVVYVFDQIDTEGKPLCELGSAQGDPTGYTERLKQFVAVFNSNTQTPSTPRWANARLERLCSCPASLQRRSTPRWPTKRHTAFCTCRNAAPRQRSASVRPRRRQSLLSSPKPSALRHRTPLTTFSSIPETRRRWRNLWNTCSVRVQRFSWRSCQPIKYFCGRPVRAGLPHMFRRDTELAFFSLADPSRHALSS
jgi:hypothetical protein